MGNVCLGIGEPSTNFDYVGDDALAQMANLRRMLR
jgi:hypothetical protein